MRTSPGGVYRLDLELLNASSGDASWLVAALAAAYPVEVLSLTPGEEPGRAIAVLTWKGPKGAIEAGSTVSLAPLLPPTGAVTEPEARIVQIDDLGGSAGSESISSVWYLVGATALLLFVGTVSMRIPSKEPSKKRAAA